VGVGVEKAHLQNHLKDAARSYSRELPKIEALVPGLVQVTSWDALDALLDVESSRCPLGIDPGDDEPRVGRKLSRYTLSVATFAGKIQLAGYRLFQTLKDLDRMEATQLGDFAFGDRRQGAEETEICLYRGFYSRAPDLQNDGASVGKAGAMDLSDGSASKSL
jgi:hypothetical protein